MLGSVRFRSPLAALFLATVCCDRATPPALDPAPDASAAPDPDQPRERAVASALVSVRSRLSLSAPAWEATPLAAGRHLLVRTTRDRLEVFSTPDFKLAFDRPLEKPRAAVEIAGGAVVVAGESLTFRVDPAAREPARLPALVWMPGSLLLPDRRDQAVLFSLERTTRTLVRQSTSLARDAGAVEPLSLEDYDGGPITVLRDGALLYRGPGGVRRAMPGSRPKAFRTPLVPWRLLPGRRVDHAWAVAADGTTELWQIGERILVLSKIALGHPPFDVASSSAYLAAVTVDEGSGKPRTFRLRVFSSQGEPVLEKALPEGPLPLGDDWATRAVEDRHVVVGELDPFVAVGGPGALGVLELPGGRPLLER